MYCRKDVPSFPVPDFRTNKLHPRRAYLLLIRKYMDAYFDATERRALVTKLWPGKTALGEKRILKLLTGESELCRFQVMKSVCETLGISVQAFFARAERDYTEGWTPNYYYPNLADEALPVPENTEEEFLSARNYTPAQVRRILDMPKRERSLHQELFLKHYPSRRDRLSLIWGGGQTTPTDTPRPALSIVPRRGLRHAS